MIQPKHLKKKIKGDYRLIVVSDIHGHLDRFKELLEKVNFQESDYLIILGDFVEKGDQVIETIHFVEELDKRKNVFVLAGNCEWALDALLTIPELAKEIPHYLNKISANGSIRYVYEKLNLVDGRETSLGVQKTIYEYLKKEINYISHLPVTLKLNDFLFVHAGLERRKDYENCSLSSMLEMQHFLDKGHILDETVIVGHLPTSNYHEDSINNGIIFDEEKRIICIDGGTGVKVISQLNALIIECKDNQITYQTKYIQPLKTVEIKNDVMIENQKWHKIAFPYFEVEVIKKGTQFSYCYQKDKDMYLNIKNEFIYLKNNHTYCLDDYTDRMMNVKKGQVVSLIGIYQDYAYIIDNGIVGWVKTKDICID